MTSPSAGRAAERSQPLVIEDRGHSGDFRLTHKAAEAYQVETSQIVTGLANGWYTLRAWVRSSGGQNEVYLALKCGSEEKRVYVPSTSPGYRWLQLVVSEPGHRWSVHDPPVLRWHAGYLGKLR